MSKFLLSIFVFLSVLSYGADLANFKPKNPHSYRINKTFSNINLIKVSEQATINAVPSINSISPMKGPVGTVVTIEGSNFSSEPLNNVVYFGAVRGKVKTSTSTKISVTVPLGATYGLVTITVNGLTAFSARPFQTILPELSPLRSEINLFNSTFVPDIKLIAEAYPSSIVAKDLNGDGLIDIATANYGSGSGSTVSVFKNKSKTAKVAFDEKHNLKTTKAISGIAAEDLDGDGKPDLVASNYGQGSGWGTTLSIFKNISSDSTILFKPKLDIEVDYAPDRIKIADIDNDGKPDIIIRTMSGAVICKNNSNQDTLSFKSVYLFKNDWFPIYDIAVVDIDGDKKVDVLALTGNGELNIFRNTSQDTFSFDKVAYKINSISGERLEVADLDSDNNIDVITCGDQGDVKVFKNSSRIGFFSFSKVFETTVEGAEIAVGNLNGDEKPDLVISGSYKSSMYVLPNISTDTIKLGQGLHYLSGNSSSKMIIADLDLDGKMEIAGGVGPSNYVWLHKNNSTIAVPTIVSVDPLASGSGQIVNVVGTNLSTIQSIKLGGIEVASFTVNSSTSVSFVVGNGASGDIEITTLGGKVVKPGFTFLNNIPTIERFSPQIAASKTTVTIKGKNFTGTTAVSFGGKTASSFSIVSDSVITAIVNTGTSGDVLVTTNNAAAIKSGFTFSSVVAQKVDSFNPTSATTGTKVIIKGTGFTDVKSIDFGGVAASSFIVNSPNIIVAVVGNGASGNVSVTTSAGVVNRRGFKYFHSPILSSFSPLSAAKGDTVNIKGEYFNQVSAVKFGGVSASSYKVISDSLITALVNSGTSGAVSVITNWGSESLSGFTFIPAPIINGVSPLVAGTGTKISIAGSNFSDVTSVKFGGTEAASFTINSSTSITSYVGSGSTGAITISSVGGSASKTGFSFVGVPTITSFTPDSVGKGNKISITGTNFKNITSVKFGGTPAASFTVNSTGTLITAVLGVGNSGEISVTGIGGTVKAVGFNFIPAPVISAFSPVSTASGEVITISGTNFDGVTSVKFGNASAASFIINSTNKITAIVGPGSSGAVSVNSIGGTSSRSGYTFISAPVITSFSPAYANSKSKITITGSNLGSASVVSFGGVPASSFKVNSTTSITAYVGAGASGNVSVTTKGGTTLLSGFKYTEGLIAIASNNTDVFEYHKLDNFSSEIMVYPNPFDFAIAINFPEKRNANKASIRLIGLDGSNHIKDIYQIKQDGVVLNLERIPSGVYTLLVNCGGTEWKKQIIKK